MKRKNSKCNLDAEIQGDQCCCMCVFRMTDFGHPHTNGKSTLLKRGHICAYGLSSGEAHSGWPEHSIGCEGFLDRRKYKITLAKVKTRKKRKTKIAFKAGDLVHIRGQIEYDQDYSFWRGRFPDVVFTVKEVCEDKLNTWISLTSHGYGNHGDEGSYGNGAIYIRPKQFKKLEKV